jgi:DNA topoisomerase IA
MQPAKYERVIVRLENNNNKFFAHNTKITYKGWMEVDK